MGIDSKKLDLFKKIIKIPCISGYENLSALPKFLYEYLKKLNYNPKIDESHNVLFQLNNGNAKTILIEAHMDEVGFIKINGQFNSIGEISKKYFYESYLEKVNENLFSFKKDIFLKKDKIFSPSLDNRVGCFSLLYLTDLFKKSAIKLNTNIIIAFTTCEETTCKGIINIVKDINPDIIISIDSAYAFPYKEKNWKVPFSGKGPAIQIKGKGFFIKNYKLIEDIAKANNIPYQYEIVDKNSGATNLSALTDYNAQKFQINIPVLNQHTDLSETNINDIENCSKLLFALIKHLDE